MIVAYHLYGGTGIHKKLKADASFANAGVPTINGVSGPIPATTTDFADSLGLALDTVTYSASPTVESLITVNIRPDAVLKALMSAGATEGTALTQHTNTTQDTTKDTISATSVGANDMTSGTVWCIKGANLGQSRVVSADTSATSIEVTVDFLNTIEVGDVYLVCPWNPQGVTDGQEVQTTTLITQADAIIASGTGGIATCVDLELNGTRDSYVLFRLGDHVYDISTI